MTKQNRYQLAFYKQLVDLSLQFRVQLPYEEILNVAEAANGYNNFNTSVLREMLKKFDEIIPVQFYNEGNPNNGNRLYRLSIGREGSMVIYLNMSGYINCGRDLEVIKLIQEKEKELEMIAYNIGKADEFSIEVEETGGGVNSIKVTSLEMRIWWD